MVRKVTDGGRKPRATDTDILEVFRETDDPVLSTAEVADRLPIKRRGTLNRLQNLRDTGELEAKQIGGRNTIWWLADSTDSRESRERLETPPNQMDDHSRDSAIERDNTASTPVLEDVDEDLREQIREGLPGSGDVLEARTDAVLEMYDVLREGDGDVVTTGELKDVVDHDAVGYASIDSFWANAIKKNAAQNRPNALTSLPGVSALGNGRYRYTGE